MITSLGASSGAEAGALAWRPSAVAPRVYFKDLAGAAGWSLQLVRLDAGGALTLTMAGGPLFLHVFEGELILRGERLWPGAAVAIRDGADPAPARSEVGCRVLILALADSAAE